MIIQCENCTRKFVVRDVDIPEEGRTVQCGYCSVTWHQVPVRSQARILKPIKLKKPLEAKAESLSVDEIKASDGKTYKFLGSQWAELLPSGKTGLFAKRKIGKELDKLTGRKERIITQKKQKKTKKKEVDPSESLNNEKKLPDIYKPKQGLGFFGYIFLLIIIGFSLVGVLKTFENDLINYYPEAEYIFELLNEQLEYVSETVKNIIVIINDLIESY
tara:strand:+ start:2951 stop:3601 length:651 start_codon:yes stop_codon:yes gene_type:complete